MRSLLVTATMVAMLAALLSCENATGGRSGSPTEAYKALYSAVKSKKTEDIKRMMSKETISFAEMVAARNGKPVDQVFENGFTATTFAESLPEIRDERVNGDWGAVEVYNAKEKRWEDLGFVHEDGGWKLAIGEMFGGKFKSPGVGRAIKEQEAANAVSNTMINGMANASNANANSNANQVKIITPKERPEPAKPAANQPPTVVKP